MSAGVDGRRAPPDEARAADEAARALACREFEVPLVLEAGAGTGKTATLVARIVTWCLGPGWDRAAAELEAAEAEAERGGGGAVDAAPATAPGDDGDPPAGDGAAGPAGRARDEAVAARVLRGVVAITFTEKAAAEMAERVGEALAALHAGRTVVGLPPEACPKAVFAPRAAALITQIEALTTCTIHAFCQRLLAQHPLEAGLHPGFRIDADGQAARRIATRTVADWVREGDPDLVALLRLECGPDALAATLFELLKNGVPAAPLLEEPYPDAAVCARAREVADSLRALVELVAEPLRAGPAGRLKLALSTLDECERLEAALREAATTDAVVGALDAEGLEKARKRVKAWRDPAHFTKAEEQAFAGRERQVARASEAVVAGLDALRGVRPQVLRPACRVLGRLLERARALMGRAGYVSFQDVLELATAVVEDVPQVRRRVQAGLDQLLVDEFQDTDPIQYRLVDALALEEGAPCPGLFLVGDPKQSIYAWRAADLGAYEDFKARLLARGGRSCALVVNFRSRPPILEEVGRVLEPVMVHERGVQPPFVPLVPHRSDAALPRGVARVEHWVSWDREESEEGALARPDVSADEASALEARALVRDLAQQHEAEGLPWSRFCVLLRGTSQQDAYAEQLERAGIPYVVERDRRYFLRREVLDALCLVRAVVDPLDLVALIGWLRGPAVGVPDAALMPLWRRGFPARLARLAGPGDTGVLAGIDDAIAAAAAEVDETRARCSELDEALERIEGWALALGVAVRALAELRVSWAEDPADECVGKMRILLRADGIESARYLGAHRLAHLDRFFAGLLADRRAGLPGEAITAKLRRVLTDSDEFDDEPPGDDTVDAVRVMTIHKAKGLEFDRVYVANLHRGTRGDRGGGNRWLRHGGRWAFRLFDAATLDFEAARRLAARVEEAENVRLLYVALTRARERLVTCGSWTEGSAHVPLIDAMRQRAPFPVPVVKGRGRRPDAAVPVATFEAAVAGDPVRWRLLGSDDEPVPARAAEGAAGVTLDVEALGRDAEHLLARRAAAESWLERRITAPVSSLTETGEDADGDDATAGPHAPAAAPAGGQLELPWDARPRRAPSGAGDVARFVGTAIHRALELWRWDRPVEEELGRARERVDAWLAASVPDERRQAARARADALLGRLADSPLAAALRDEQRGELGREVPVLVAGDLVGRDETAVVVGAIDRLVRDEDGCLAVVDYKTDRLDGEGGRAAFVARHAGQARLYARAVEEALDVAPPRARLHVLDAGASETLDPDGA